MLLTDLLKRAAIRRSSHRRLIDRSLYHGAVVALGEFAYCRLVAVLPSATPVFLLSSWPHNVLDWRYWY